MSKSEKSRWLLIRDYIFRNLFWILISVSLVIFLWANYCSHEQSRYILTQAGIAILSSGVFAAALKSRQFKGLFREEIEKVILGTEFIKNRKDLPELWKAISKSIYREKFPLISDEMERIILTNYFPTEHDFYYENFHVDIEIKEITDDFVIKYVQTSRFNVITAHDVTNTELIFDSKIDSASNVEVINQLDFLSLNGENQKVSKKKTTVNDATNSNFRIPLEGNGNYKVHMQYTRQYSLQESNVLLFKMRRLTKGMIVSVDYPENVNASFFDLGMVDAFSSHLAPRSNRISKIHEKGIILPYQGFGISFDRHKKRVDV